MLYTLKVAATIVLAFIAGTVIHRVLWKFFDWVLDGLERMDEEDRL